MVCCLLSTVSHNNINIAFQSTIINPDDVSIQFEEIQIGNALQRRKTFYIFTRIYLISHY